MKIGFIENNLRLTSSGACNLVYEWYKLLSTKHEVDFVHWDKDITNSFVTEDFKNVLVRHAMEQRAFLEEYDMLIVNHLGEPSVSFFNALQNCKKPITTFVYHDRTVARDIFTDPTLKTYISICDYVLTYQPKLLIEKLQVPEEKIMDINIITFYKDPKEYLNTYRIPIRQRKIQHLYCNRTNNFKGAKLFMDWCKFLREKEDDGRRVMKGFNSEFPHKDLSNYDTKPNLMNRVSCGSPIDFYTEDYSDHKRCKELLRQSKFVWLAQDYSNYPKEYFKLEEEYLSYLNPDLDGTTLEAIFSGCVPIFHVFNKKCELLSAGDLDKCCLFYDPEKGYDDLYQQYKQIDVVKATEHLKYFVELYKAKDIFLNGLEFTITPKQAFQFYKGMTEAIEE